MGNAVEALYHKKVEARKRQAEKEKEIYQACLAWSRKIDEQRQKEITDRQEKIRNQKQDERMKKDHHLMETYLKNIEKDKIREKEEIKHRDEEMKKRKVEAVLKSNRRFHEKEEHIKRESEIMKKNMNIIERKTARSREEMKSRLSFIAMKKVEDRKRFVRKVSVAERNRKKELDINKRRIKAIEKKIVNERYAWQQQLMTARRIPSENRISTRELLQKGREAIEKRKMLYQKIKEENSTKEQCSPKKFEWKHNRTADVTVNRKSSKQIPIANSLNTGREILPVVKEEKPAVLEQEYTIRNADELMVETIGDNKMKTRDSKVVIPMEANRFQRLYVPQKPENIKQAISKRLNTGIDIPKINKAFKLPTNRISGNISGTESSATFDSVHHVSSHKEKEKSKGSTVGKLMTEKNGTIISSDTKSKTDIGRKIEKTHNTSYSPTVNGNSQKQNKSYLKTTKIQKLPRNRHSISLSEKSQEEETLKQTIGRTKGVLGEAKVLQERKVNLSSSDPLLLKSENIEQKRTKDAFRIKHSHANKIQQTKKMAFVAADMPVTNTKNTTCKMVASSEQTVSPKSNDKRNQSLDLEKSPHISSNEKVIDNDFKLSSDKNNNETKTGKDDKNQKDDKKKFENRHFKPKLGDTKSGTVVKVLTQAKDKNTKPRHEKNSTVIFNPDKGATETQTQKENGSRSNIKTTVTNLINKDATDINLIGKNLENSNTEVPKRDSSKQMLNACDSINTTGRDPKMESISNPHKAGLDSKIKLTDYRNTTRLENRTFTKNDSQEKHVEKSTFTKTDSTIKPQRNSITEEEVLNSIQTGNIDTNSFNSNISSIAKDQTEAKADTGEIKEPLKLRTGPVRTATVEKFVIDQRISAVQRRIDKLIKVNTNDIPVV